MTRSTSTTPQARVVRRTLCCLVASGAAVSACATDSNDVGTGESPLPGPVTSGASTLSYPDSFRLFESDSIVALGDGVEERITTGMQDRLFRTAAPDDRPHVRVDHATLIGVQRIVQLPVPGNELYDIGQDQRTLFYISAAPGDERMVAQDALDVIADVSTGDGRKHLRTVDTGGMERAGRKHRGAGVV